MVAVEPSGAAVLSGQSAGAHHLPGLGAGFIPEILNRAIIDEVITVTEEQAVKAQLALARREGIAAGMSSGAALTATSVAVTASIVKQVNKLLTATSVVVTASIATIKVKLVTMTATTVAVTASMLKQVGKPLQALPDGPDQ